MDIEEAKIILKFHRPDRPRSTDRRQLQKAIDVILEDQRPTSYWVDDEHGTTCHHCGSLSHRWSKFCPDCGAQMGNDQNEGKEPPFIVHCRNTAIQQDLPLYCIYYEKTGVFEVYVTETKELYEKRHLKRHLSDYEFQEIAENYLIAYERCGDQNG